jgi:lycopene cyclase domain-containing protein
MHAYTIGALTAVALSIIFELFIVKSRIYSKKEFWITILIVVLFQIPTDGWLTKTSAPIVIYNPNHFSGLRLPFSIPVEDFLYGFALVSAVLSIWERLRQREDR